jgi:hypothetical protein
MSVRVTDQGKDWQKRDDEVQRRHPIRPSVDRSIRTLLIDDSKSMNSAHLAGWPTLA